jgi:predicted enzyme related to lactoylglutathione lyase
MSDFNRDNNRAVWFDIPVVDLDRATSFYADVLALKVDIQSFGDVRFAVIAHDDGNGGCLVVRPEEISPGGGVLLYLNVHGRIREAVKQVEKHGGKIVEEVQSIGPHGFRAIIQDTEGNRIARHSDTDA